MDSVVVLRLGIAPSDDKDRVIDGTKAVDPEHIAKHRLRRKQVGGDTGKPVGIEEAAKADVLKSQGKTRWLVAWG
ncbi:hypothetical protein Poly41_59370 [Novipirellula artificiosorum]|uniref:Uncharacterized protein n=1 Tax=Novipirellula artificiosorum TaxID=2528016 RepID=A0A5C6DB00_9BACT|nr:hypothetical protein Poly41_59370 [Novipirellula artificiosorum]